MCSGATWLCVPMPSLCGVALVPPSWGRGLLAPQGLETCRPHSQVHRLRLRRRGAGRVRKGCELHAAGKGWGGGPQPPSCRPERGQQQLSL